MLTIKIVLNEQTTNDDLINPYSCLEVVFHYIRSSGTIKQGWPARRNSWATQYINKYGKFEIKKKSH